MRTVNVRATASVANMVCGFDVLGMALEEPYDEMRVTLLDKREIIIHHTDGYGLPEAPEKNVAGAALFDLMQEYDGEIGFELTVHKNIKPGSGLGSSAAGSAGAVVAANHLLDNHFSKNDLVRFAMAGEKLASGVKHADNIAPGIFGGVTLIRSIFPLDIVSLDTPPLFVSVIHPQIEIKTSDARQILRKEVLLKDAIRQWGNIAGLVAGLIQKDYALIGRSLEDVIIEPVRSMLIPGFKEIKDGCRQVGALGGGISGSGPSVFMLSQSQEIAISVSAVMEAVYTKLGVEYKTYVTQISSKGIKIMDDQQI